MHIYITNSRITFLYQYALFNISISLAGLLAGILRAAVLKLGQSIVLKGLNSFIAQKYNIPLFLLIFAVCWKKRIQKRLIWPP